MKIATYNIHRCVGQDNQENQQRILHVLREMDADIVALQEVASLHSSPDNFLAQISASTQMMAYPGFTLIDRDSRYGNALLSRFPLEHLEKIDLTVPHREPRGLIKARFLLGQQPWTVLATHLGLAPHERRQQMKRIVEELPQDPSMPVILMGDCNEWFIWSRPLRWLHNYFVPSPSPATFPVHRPLFRLDRIWVRPHHLVHKIYAHTSPTAKMASDHLPLLVELERKKNM